MTVDNSALGSCTCDVTLNSCDAYCCCDTDCEAPVLALWNKYPDQYCALNKIGAEYNPQKKCVDNG